MPKKIGHKNEIKLISYLMKQPGYSPPAGFDQKKIQKFLQENEKKKKGS